MLTDEVKEWFLKARGITPETLEAFNVSVNEKGGVEFDYSGQRRIRYGIPEGDRSFKWEKGSKATLFRAEAAKEHTHCFLVEGETDTMRLWQELGDEAGVGVVGMPGVSTWKDEYKSLFDKCEKVWVILDNDDYASPAKKATDDAWRSIRFSLGAKARRLTLPQEIKDVCEFFNHYDIEALRLLAKRNPLSESRFSVLDLTAEPPPVRWVVEGLICRGDIHLLIGEPGIGKSWLTMALSLGIAAGHQEFLGKPIKEHGRVLYLDEENPEDLVFDRFRKLGMAKEDAKNIRYINNFGIRLDKSDADDVVEEALEFQPTLVVLDSLTRFHTEDENHAGAMAGLFHNAIKPLARETGAAVVLIHHANKSDSNSSYRRSRGSGDITASVDCGYDVREIGESNLAVANFKSRRQAQGDTMYVSIVDTEEGRVELIGGQQPELPF